VNNLAFIVKSGVFEGRYISGALCGKQHDVQKICFVAPKGYGSLKRWANAIFLGIRHENATRQLYIGLTADFDHPATEQVVINHFVNNIGCDIIIQHQDSIYPQTLIAAANKLGIGWGTDMRQFGGETVLTSIVSNWDVDFIYFTEKVIAGTFIPERFIDTLTNEALEMAPYSSMVTNSAKVHAENVQRKLMDGRINPFCGQPVLEQYGTECTTETNLIANYLPGINLPEFDGTV